MNCSDPGCGLSVRSKGLCSKHYMRMYRHGHTGRKVVAHEFEHSHGYVMVPAPGHFLARGTSHAYAHRINYFDAHGSGPFKCHWCAIQVTWDDMHIDHLDNDKANNLVANLVASCPICNQARGHGKARATWRERTGWSAFGLTLTPNEWAARVGLSRQSILCRLRNGWTLERALSEPRGKFGPPGKGNWDQTDWRPEEYEPEHVAHLRLIKAHG